MARPVKNNCDYFPHDGDMRNHRKVKAIITKFGLTGYAHWSMLLEILTTSEDFKIKMSNDIEWELMASDLHTDSLSLKDFISYLVTLELVQKDGNYYWSDNLIDRFSSLLAKRLRAKKSYEENNKIEAKIGKKIQSTNGLNRALRLEVFQSFDFKCIQCGNGDPDVLDVHHKLARSKGGSDDIDNLELLCANCHRKEHSCDVSVTETIVNYTETTQSKVNQSKVNDSKVKEIKGKERKEEQTISSADAELELWPSFDDFWNAYGKKIDKPKCLKKWEKIKQGAREKIMEHLELYVRSTPDIQFRKNPLTYLNSESWENEIIISNGTHQNGKQRITEKGSVDRLNSYT